MYVGKVGVGIVENRCGCFGFWSGFVLFLGLIVDVFGLKLFLVRVLVFWYCLLYMNYFILLLMFDVDLYILGGI